MRKLFTFVMLLCTVCIGAVAQSFPETGTYYMNIENKDTGRMPFLYNDMKYSDDITIQAATVGTANGFIWKITTDGTNITKIVNAETGKGIKATGKCTGVMDNFTLKSAGDGFYYMINTEKITGDHDRLNCANDNAWKNEAGLRSVTTWTFDKNDNAWRFNAVETAGMKEYTVKVEGSSKGFAEFGGKKAGNNGFFLSATAPTTSTVTAGQVAGAKGEVTSVEGTTITVTYTSEPIEYLVFSGGVPEGVVIKVKGTEVKPEESWTVGATYSADGELGMSDITVEECGNGNVYTVELDNSNHQININFTQIFEPIASIADKASATKYYIKNPQGYYPHLDANGNMFGTNVRSEADKFIFISGAIKGQYYIYDLTAEKYVYATGTGNGTTQQTQAGSKVQLTTEQSTASCWTFDPQICITPAAGGESGWNFCGGSVGYVLNLWANSDGNSKWEIVSSDMGSLACATTMFSTPGEEYMHKLVPEAGVTVTSLELTGDLTDTDLKLYEDRVGKGNDYKYVRGTAPTKEGEYTYFVHLSDGTKAKVSLTVSNFLQSPTPGMVWVSWNWFKHTIDAQNLLETAQGLVAKGLYDAGFNTIVIDDAWGTGTKNNNITLTYNTEKFPKGMKAFVDEVNSTTGVKVGIYSDAAGATCGGYQPGSLGVEKQHVQMFDEWGIDFLKYDFCGGLNAFKSYKTMGDAIAQLNATRQERGEGEVPFVFNACEWGTNNPWTWGAEAGTSMWRATQDAREDWIGTHQFPGALGGSDEVRDLWMWAGVNRFNDLDMMCIGLHGKGSPSNHTASWGRDGGQLPEASQLKGEKGRTQMSIWSMLASPLSISCDVRVNPSNPCNSSAGVDKLEGEDLQILTNKDIISISQDPLGQQAEYFPNLGTNSADFATSGLDVYAKDLKGGNMALAIVNRNANGTAESKTINLADIYLDGTKKYNVLNVWTGDKTTATGSITTGSFKAAETKVYILSTEDTTGVTALTTGSTQQTAVYDLQGRRTANGTNGLLIENGQKVLK